MYRILIDNLGQQSWWPADSKFEVIVGAILTQNTNWNNVEKAINNLKKAGLLSVYSIYNSQISTLSKYIKPAGYYNVKSSYLKNFAKAFIEDFDGELKKIMKNNEKDIRKWLLSIKGIGKETADSIILYAFGKPIFIVDAYTKRIFRRHDIISDMEKYDDIRNIVEKNIPRDSLILGEFHALLVKTGKKYCQIREPLCKKCPLSELF